MAKLLAQESPPRPGDVALILAALGDDQAALDWIARAVRSWSPVPFLGVDPLFRKVLALPHAAATIEEATAASLQQAREEYVARGWSTDPWAAP
ncbi:MAG TPA: hypothetical protein VFV70_00825 [Hyphomonadaceae bacterium]|nr:hypothetical protein [Hyphomonadaceae bacterium]